MRRNFFAKLILTMALLAVVPSLVSNIVAYFKVSDTFRKETAASKQQYLNQTINAIEIVLNRIKENANQLALNRSFQKFERFPRGGYYESLQGELRKEDLPALYSYLEAKKNAIETFHTFRLSNAFVDSVYYYDDRNQSVLTSDNDGSNRQFGWDEFYDKGWYDRLPQAAETIFFTDTRMARQYRSPDKNVLTLLYKTGRGNSAFIINLDAEMMHTKIFSRLNRQDDIYVVSAEGNILFHKNAARLHQSIRQVLPSFVGSAGEAGYFEENVDGSPKLVGYAESPLLGWTFMNVSDMEALSKGTVSMKRTIALSAVLLFLLSLMLAYLSSKRLYRPIQRLKSMAGWNPDRRKLERTDELGVIGRFMQSAIDERDYYKEKLDRSLPIQREQFKAALLRRNRMTAEEISARQNDLNVDLDRTNLVVMAIALDEPDRQETGTEARMTGELRKLRVTDTIGRSPLLLGAKRFLVETEQDVVALVLSCGGMDRQQVFRLGQRLLDEANRELGGRFTIGVGRTCESARDLPQSYEEAIEALKYRVLYGSGDVISIEDSRLDGAACFRYPKEKEEQILGCLKTGRGEEAIRAFGEFVAEIEAHKSRMHYNQLQPPFVQLLTAILGAFAQLGADVGSVLGEEADLYRELLGQSSMSRIVRWFERVIQASSAYIERELSAKGNQHIARAVEIIERDYALDLSLNAVAERLKLNPAYISRLFKQITGDTFVDYLKAVRLERSKELLLGGGMKIGEVGRLVGYSHSYYFIKVFKEQTGLTPGEYRKLHGAMLRPQRSGL
ncbi:helix-turn-helix domain-containing protein [Paenibacillus arenilitoris]|uniref:AraC family transcriptional regulator n=1 Tax=Paenibacillus arenilitoris TaxID=2772299 RepID=A0A927CPJ7_9BACL|nr:helix-turn-helix domain-containing protein [Paenibacillus arenilitoris]MBD2871858.1 AraC family transcriptional regulator [Paenibacillus arenilitoris]